MNNNDNLRFSKYIRNFIKYNDNENNPLKKVTIKELCNRLNTNYETLKKRLNKSRPVKSRDYIIALCSQLEMNTEQTNEALYRYGFSQLCENISLFEKLKNKQLIISDEDCYLFDKQTINNDNNYILDSFNRLIYRDMFISSILNLKQYISIKRINILLKKCNYNELNITNNILKETNIDHSNNYLLKEFKTITYDKDFIFLELLNYNYNIKSYNYYSYCNLYKNDNISYQLRLYNNGIKKITDCKTYLDISTKNDLYNKFYEYFDLLEELNKSYIIDLFNTLNDTKYFTQRITAKNIDGYIHFFMEKYITNPIYSIKKYLLIEYTNNSFNYAISNESYFLYNYMDKKEFLNYSDNIPKYEINRKTINGLKTYCKNNNINFNLIYDNFDSMKYDLKKFVNLFVNKKEKISNHKLFNYDILEYPVAKYFNLINEFKFKPGKSLSDFCPEIIYGNTINTIKLPYKDKEIEINFDILFDAFDLGFENINDVLKILYEYGSLDNYLKTLIIKDNTL